MHILLYSIFRLQKTPQRSFRPRLKQLLCCQCSRVTMEWCCHSHMYVADSVGISIHLLWPGSKTCYVHLIERELKQREHAQGSRSSTLSEATEQTSQGHKLVLCWDLEGVPGTLRMDDPSSRCSLVCTVLLIYHPRPVSNR